MAVSIVQSKTATTTAAGTLSARLNGVVANHLLFALTAQQDVVESAAPTDSVSDAWQQITAIGGLGNVSIGAFYARLAKGGNTTISDVTTAASEGYCAELAGTAAITLKSGLVIGYDGVVNAQSVGSNPNAGLSYSTSKGGLGFILLAVVNDPVAGAPLITFTGTGWTSLGSGTFGSISWQAYQQSSATPVVIPFGWTLADASGQPLACNWAIMGVEFPAA